MQERAHWWVLILTKRNVDRILQNSKGERKMERYITLIIILALLLSITGCVFQTRQDKVLASLGRYDSEQLWTHGGFQDYTDFGKYSYSSINIDQNSYFKKVSSPDIEIIHAFIDDFEKYIDAFRNNDPNDELALNYTFDCSSIDTGDYFYIYEGENYPKFGCYDVWIFDCQTKILYYFHNNI